MSFVCCLVEMLFSGKNLANGSVEANFDDGVDADEADVERFGSDIVAVAGMLWGHSEDEMRQCANEPVIDRSIDR